jgi:tetratricopeptide (TPR) repeat protein
VILLWYSVSLNTFIVKIFSNYSDILRRESMNADALYVRGMCLYYQDNMEKAFQHFQQVLRLAPDHQKAKDTYRVSVTFNMLEPKVYCF